MRAALPALLGGLSVGAPASRADAAAPKRPACVSYQTEARYRLGYDHLVHVTNDCSRAVQCTVRTNVNPSPVEVHVAPRSVETVLTFRGSPANTFQAELACSWAD